MNKPAKSPLITVAIPVYNREATLKQAIDSLLAQTYPHWQLLVHDNCSSDGSREIVRRFSDERITLIEHKEFVPMWQSWNRCLQRIEGDFFQMLCSDDWLHPRCFEEKIKLASQAQYADITLFTSNRMLVNKYGADMFSLGFSRTGGVYTLTDVMRQVYIKISPIGDPGTFLIRRSAIAEASLTSRYPLIVDNELWLHALEKGKMLHNPRVCSYHRINDGLSGAGMIGIFRDSLRFYRQYARPFYTHHLPKYYLGYGYLSYRTIARYLLNRLAPHWKHIARLFRIRVK